MRTCRIIIGALCLLCGLWALPSSAKAQDVVFASSDPLVIIHSTFTGQVLTLFGNVAPGDGKVPETGPYDVVVVVRGPAGDRIVREKARLFGMVLNADQASYRTLPGYYAVMSSRPPESIIGADGAQDPRFSLHQLAASARVEQDKAVFDAELVRLMVGEGRYIASPRGVTFHSATTFSTRVPLPSNVPNGLFIAQAFVVAGGEIVASTATSFTVRSEGFERFVSRSAQINALFYGLAAVFIAMATGWLGGVLFKR